MIQQLVRRLMMAPPGMSRNDAAHAVLTADPLDLFLHVEQVWSAFNPPPGAAPPLAAPARTALAGGGRFGGAGVVPPAGARAWDHLAYSYVLENTRVVQILRRVVQEFRSGERIGLAHVDTQRWLDATEALLFGSANPFARWLSSSSIRPDSEAQRRNAYFREMGVELAFGTEDNQPPSYVKAEAHNGSFVPLFEELLFELWQAIMNVRNLVGANSQDNDRIYRLAEALQYELRARRLFEALDREELAAATVLGWAELTFSYNSPVISDTGSEGTNEATRLINLGSKVNMAPHSKSSSMFSMAAEISLFLRAIEAGVVSGPEFAWVLYLEAPPPGAPAGAPAPIGAESRRVITEWAAATGRDLKNRAKPVETSRRQLVRVQ
ncbi:MAG TPA: hypothetical protein VGX37_05185 [Allosphingosinicella sp.]|jgi:hypothetical protein|nr:hypothetical protein [Allosphingosinicella sp.]